jgi:3-deoxy-D-manno-octulosonic acid kinase
MNENESRVSIKHINGPEGYFALLFDADRWPQLSEHQFNASGYANAQPVAGQGGRGSAWFVPTPAGDAVLKHYLRGGFLAKFVHDCYFYLGARRTRGFREFELLMKLSTLGLPVPKPLAAFCRRGLFSYRAALVTERLPNIQSLVSAVQQSNAPWQVVGETLARFHKAGAHHSDLNANNILLNRQNEAFIIDWDKCTLEDAPGAWCEKVLARLQRSLLKECKQHDTTQLQLGMAHMLRAYQKAML